MERITASLPDSVAELALLRLGLQARSLSAWRFVRRLRGEIVAEARRAKTQGEGLLHSEWFRLGIGHSGVLQYWRSFEALEAWARREPHALWWRAAVERMRMRRDLGVYHELYVVRPGDIESIFIDCRPAGLAAFGVRGEPVGPSTTSRGRLGRSRA
jgi:hypothetical protein